MGLSCICFAYAGSFLMYALAAALTGVGYCWAGMVPLSMAPGPVGTAADRHMITSSDWILTEKFSVTITIPETMLVCKE